MQIVEDILLAVFVALLYGLLAALPFMLLWNCLMVWMFGLKEIGFMQAVGFLWIAAFLFHSSSSSSKE